MDRENKRISKNTFYLTIRMILLMLISFYTSRVVLDKLGVEDFGIYNVVSSFAVTFAFFTSALTNATQRFLTIELGRNEKNVANRILNQHIIVYALISLLVIIAAEIIGIYYIDNKLNIDSERIFAAHWAYQFSLLNIVIGLLCIPYESLFVAHEEMKVYSYVSVWEGVFKLFIVYLLTISSVDKLILYSFLVFLVNTMCRFYYALYSHRKFEECFYKWYFNIKEVINVFKFIGWNILSAGQVAVCDQGISLILNAFCGPMANAARGITGQIVGIVFRFINNLLIAFQPQMVKCYATGESNKLNTLFLNSSRFSFFVLWLFACPLICCINAILNIWLVEVPRWTSQMIVLNMIAAVFYVLTKPIWIIVVASGKLKYYTLITSTIAFLTFPASCIALYLGFEAPVVYKIFLIANIVDLFAQLLIVRKYFKYNVKDYLTKVLRPIFLIFAFSFVPSYLLSKQSSGSFLDTIFVCFGIIVVTLISIFVLGISTSERQMALNKVKTYFRK